MYLYIYFKCNIDNTLELKLQLLYIAFCPFDSAQTLFFSTVAHLLWL